MAVHELKTWPEMFELVFAGRKTFEVRPDDRGYSERDMLRLREWRPDTGEYTGRELSVLVTLVVRGKPLPDGFCAMQIWPNSFRWMLDAHKEFVALVDRIVAGHVSDLVIAHKDRLARFGFELLQHLCQHHVTRLHVINMQELSPEQEMVQDLMAITHCFSARLYGLRNYHKALKKALQP